jgi:hypothetical protein
MTVAADAQLSSLLADDERSRTPLLVQLALTLALRGSPQDRTSVDELATRIGNPRFDGEPLSAAHFLLLQALRAPSGGERERYLSELDAALADIGSGGNWLRQQLARLRGSDPRR